VKLKARVYYCPVCKNVENHTTNHEGEIYCHCERCGNNPLFCGEAEALDELASRPFVNAVLKCYSFDVGTVEGAEQHLNLSAALRAARCECFKVLSEYRSREALSKHDGALVRLYKPFQWKDQFACSIGRLHRWHEAVVPNRAVKSGYYLADLSGGVFKVEA
jgi:hypothetical protein